MRRGLHGSGRGEHNDRCGATLHDDINSQQHHRETIVSGTTTDAPQSGKNRFYDKGEHDQESTDHHIPRKNPGHTKNTPCWYYDAHKCASCSCWNTQPPHTQHTHTHAHTHTRTHPHPHPRSTHAHVCTHLQVACDSGSGRRLCPRDVGVCAFHRHDVTQVHRRRQLVRRPDGHAPELCRRDGVAHAIVFRCLHRGGDGNAGRRRRRTRGSRRRRR